MSDEETAIVGEQVGEILVRRLFQMGLPIGKEVTGDEHFFLVRTDSPEISAAGGREHENTLSSDYRWWDLASLRHTTETVYSAEIPVICLQAST
ncbi:hypothetical protein ACQPT2_12210 [Erwinia amylovora]